MPGRWLSKVAPEGTIGGISDKSHDELLVIRGKHDELLLSIGGGNSHSTPSSGFPCTDAITETLEHSSKMKHQWSKKTKKGNQVRGRAKKDKGFACSREASALAIAGGIGSISVPSRRLFS